VKESREAPAVFKYDGKDEFKYTPKDTSTVSSTGKDYDE
jgi:hypothetical protein